MAMAAALWPPSWNWVPMRSIMLWAVGAESSHSSNTLLPRPSLQEPISMIVPPFFTACLALSSAFWVWYRFRSFGAPPWDTITMSARRSRRFRYMPSRNLQPSRWAFTRSPATARTICLCSSSTTFTMKSTPTIAAACSMSCRTGLVSRLPAQASSFTIMLWLHWIAAGVDTPGMMAFAPPE